MDKPDVDFIEGLSPAVSIDQKSTSRNPRSTVGTITEVYDYLRLLFARIGKPHCPECGRPDLPAVAAGHRRPGAGAAGGQPLPGALAAGARAQGRVRRPLRRPADQGLQPGPGGRRDRPAHRPAHAEEAGEAHHRGGRRPPHGQGHRQAPAHRLRGDRPRPVRRHGRARLRRPPRGRPASASGCSPSTCTARTTTCPSRSWSRAPSPSTRPSAPAPTAPASARAWRSTPS